VITLDRLAATLGSGVLRVLAAPSGTGIELEGVVIHDPADPPPLGSGNLALAVGLGPGEEMRRLMERAAAEGAVLVVKTAPAGEAALSAHAEELGLTLAAVAPGAAWMQIASLLRGAIRDDAVARDNAHLAGAAAGDLFAIANAVAAIIDAPVTIEDRQARVIAFSSRQDEADEARMATILGRQVPEDYYRRLVERGVFRTLYSAERPIYIDDISPEVLPRVAVAVKAGGELLGSIWAAVSTRPSDAQLAEFGEAANFVALHLLRHRIAADVQRELRSELVSAVLSGRALASDAAARLGLDGQGYRVLAVALRGDRAVDDAPALVTVWDTLALHLSVPHRRAVTGLLEGAVYAIVPLAADRERSRRSGTQVAQEFLARLAEPMRRLVVIGVGGHARSLAELPRSRRDADRIVRLLRDRDDGQGLVAAIEDARLEVLLLRLAELGDDDLLPDDGPIAALREHDARRGTRYVDTLRVYLEEFGDISRAAARLGVHHNTFRYRLAKVQQFPGVTLDDPGQRLALELQLRLGGRSQPGRCTSRRDVDRRSTAAGSTSTPMPGPVGTGRRPPSRTNGGVRSSR
jgi:DNA-binding PucR family transcriptional regulator